MVADISTFIAKCNQKEVAMDRKVKENSLKISN